MKINDTVLIPESAAEYYWSSRLALVDKITENSAGVKIVQVFTYSGGTFKFRQDQLTVVPSDC